MSLLRFASGFAGENEEDDQFDMIVGALEEIMMDDEFQDLQSAWLYIYAVLAPCVVDMCCGR